jgi:hypothetical protein
VTVFLPFGNCFGGEVGTGGGILSWITKGPLESHADEQKEHEAAIKRREAE